MNRLCTGDSVRLDVCSASLPRLGEVKEREDYGVILFTSLFVKHPEYHLLFKKFRANNLSALKKDPKFRSSNRKDSKGHVVHEQPVSTSPGSS
ncbi:uncharacterized protein [Dermacentor albipictus]|uniref:uncharacterized protein isoform X2 n=1 Tax=Dermacentor albipictus TaxID=60249 RepID=UPI0038FCFA19